MLVIGLTGSLGTGKSTVAGMFADLGAKVLDADQIAHKLLRPGAKCFKPTLRLLGSEILTRGRIDRKKIAAKVFLNTALLRRLERIIHPEVKNVILNEMRLYKNKNRSGILILDVPLLFESKLHHCVDFSVVVKTNKKTQMARSTERLNITKAEAQRRINAQMPLRQKIRLADIIIDNNGTLIQTQKQVKRIWEEL